MYSGRVVLLESNKEGLIVLILAGLSVALVDSQQTARNLLASSDKTVGGSCCGSSFGVRQVHDRMAPNYVPPTRIHLLHLYLSGISALSSMA